MKKLLIALTIATAFLTAACGTAVTNSTPAPVVEETSPVVVVEDPAPVVEEVTPEVEEVTPEVEEVTPEVEEVELIAEITFPVEANIIEDDCTSGDCWNYRNIVPSFYECEASTDAAFRAANCTLEHITLLVNKSCGKVANSARPQSYQYYVVFNPSDTPVILNVNWGTHMDYVLTGNNWTGANFQHTLYNGVTYDIRGEVTLEDGTLVTEFPIYTQTKNC
tara:strand:+ start:1017 stop:1679 length:663 start_codon:yes stop_codon:yes gene_type:complete